MTVNSDAAAATVQDQGGRDKVLARMLRTAVFGLTALIGIGFLLLPAVFSKAMMFSPLWFYGLLILVASAVGFGLEHIGRTSWAVVVLYALLFDIALGVTTKVGSALSLTASFFPEHKRSLLIETGFRFHPLLQIMLTPGYDQGGYAHTAYATRVVAEPAREPAAKTNVALIGGSSTYDIDRLQGETWPDRLQAKLPQYRFWNFGVPSYTSVAHVTQTAWYTPEVGTQCAIYYVGWNDVRNNNLPNLDPAYAEYHLLDLGKYARDLTDNGATATWRMLSLVIWSLRPQPGVPKYYATLTPRDGVDPKLEKYYRQNLETIIGINRQRGVKVGFIGQLLNYPLLRQQPKGQRSFGAPGTEDAKIPDAMERLNTVMAEAANDNGVPYLAPQQDWLGDGDYTDFGHFSIEGAKKFADRVSGFIDATCSGAK